VTSVPRRRPLERAALAVVPVLVLGGCVSVPAGPSVMALPGSGRSFGEFQGDDALCRDWAAHQTGIAPERAAVRSGVASAAVGTLVGAAAGTAIGAAVGDPGGGAAVGAGSGLLVGSAAGAGRSHVAHHEAQSRYDHAYLQCMYAQGNQIPVARGSVASPPAPPRTAPPPRSSAPPPPGARAIPPPPPGLPPPPPPGAY